MQEVISEIVEEWSKRVPSGIVNTKDEAHLNTLIGVMIEYIGDQQIIREWIKNIIKN